MTMFAMFAVGNLSKASNYKAAKVVNHVLT